MTFTERRIISITKDSKRSITIVSTYVSMYVLLCDHARCLCSIYFLAKMLWFQNEIYDCRKTVKDTTWELYPVKLLHLTLAYIQRNVASISSIRTLSRVPFLI